jgi:hypothetical protein
LRDQQLTYYLQIFKTIIDGSDSEIHLDLEFSFEAFSPPANQTQIKIVHEIHLFNVKFRICVYIYLFRLFRYILFQYLDVFYTLT